MPFRAFPGLLGGFGNLAYASIWASPREAILGHLGAAGNGIGAFEESPQSKKPA